MIRQKINNRNYMQGQSLVETALFLPILIIVLAGIVEVSSLLITQNRITTASRVATGYGVNHYTEYDWEGTANSMGVVAINTVTETMEMDLDQWDIWSIYAKVNEDGTDFEEFEAQHVMGNHLVISASEWVTREAQVRADMLAELQSTGNEHASDLEVVASVVYHNQKTMLNLPIWQWTGFQTVRGLTVMRVDGPKPFVGCPLLPVSIQLDQYSAYPSDWAGGPLNTDMYPGHNTNNMMIFPEGNGPKDFEYPNPAPSYTSVSADKTIFTGGSEPFERNYPGVPLRDAQPGYIYLAREQGAAGGFGWLCWKGCSSQDLRESLGFPGNFLDPVTGYPGSTADMGTLDTGGNGPSGNQNGNLEVGEWIQNSTGNIASADIEFYVDREMPITLVVFDKTNGRTGSNATYRVGAFAIARILGFSLQGNDKFLVFEFVDWGSACVLDD